MNAFLIICACMAFLCITGSVSAAVCQGDPNATKCQVAQTLNGILGCAACVACLFALIFSTK